MIKTVQFDVKHYPNLPASLCQPNTTTRLDELNIDIDEFCHVVWEDSFGPVPTPNPAVASLVALLTSAPAFEFAGPGPGINTETRRSESNKYGRGFCRWLLYKHVNMTFFATINELISRGFPAPLNTWKIKKIPGGDSPDYLCSDNATTIALGEAKGRLSSITWTAPKQFPEWRNQFKHVEICDATNVRQRLKGYIVATQMKSSTKSSMQSKIFVEDPDIRGEADLTSENARELQRAIVASHYGDVLTRLRHPVHAAYLRLGVGIKGDRVRRSLVWECLIPSLRGRQFVGGVYRPAGVTAFEAFYDYSLWNAGVRLRQNPLLDLGAPFTTFFGLEISVYDAVIDAAYSGLASLERVEVQQVPAMPEGTSMLRDGTLLCPVEFMRPLNELTV